MPKPPDEPNPYEPPLDAKQILGGAEQQLRGGNTVKSPSWSEARRIALRWILAAAIPGALCAVLLHFATHGRTGVWVEIAVLGLMAVPFILPWIAGTIHRSWRVVGLTALFGTLAGAIIFGAIIGTYFATNF